MNGGVSASGLPGTTVAQERLSEPLTLPDAAFATEQEERALGCLLWSGPGLLAAARATGLERRHFFRDSHKHCWDAVLALTAAGEDVTPENLTRRLARLKQPDVDEWAQWKLPRLRDAPDDAGLVEVYARAVVRAAALRSAVAMLAQARRHADDGDLDALLAAVYAALPAVEAEVAPRVGGANGTATAPGAVVLKLEAVTRRRLRWGWPGRLLIGAINLIEGDPDDGKSLISLDLAARFSTGQAMPDGTPSGFDGPVTVLLLCSEDDPETTVAPRLLAAGADLSRVRLLQSISEPVPDKDKPGRPTGQTRPRRPVWPDDADEIHRQAGLVGAEVLVIDPLAAYLARHINPNSDQEIRDALAPTQDWAKAEQRLVLLVRHLNKRSGESNPKYRGGGSIGLLGLARSALLVGADPDARDGEDRRVLVMQKHNLAKGAPGLAYRVSTLRDPELGDDTPYVEWLGPSRHTARSLLAPPDDPDEAGILGEAVRFLKQYLGAVPRKSDDVAAEAKKLQISQRTLERARARLGVISSPFYVTAPDGSQKFAYWLLSLPPLPPPAQAPTQAPTAPGGGTP